MTLKFTRMGTWHESTECGRYTVSATKHEDKYVWCAYLNGKPDVLLGCKTNAEDARQLCRENAFVPEMDFATHAEMTR